MALKYYHDIDLSANQLLNSRLQNITTAARITLGGNLTINDKGFVVYDTDLLEPFFWDGLNWQSAGGITSIIWGGITGTITDQTDLITYLSTNYYPLSSNPAGYLDSTAADLLYYPLSSNPAGYLTTETDPVFTSWLATPPNVSIFTNDAGYLTSASLSGYVPYIGATTNVDLGEWQLKAGQLEFDQSPTGTAGVGILRWNSTDGTLDLGLKGGSVTLQIGQENVIRVVNKSGGDLLESDFQVVRVRLVSEGGASGQRLAVKLAQADNDTNSATTLGVVTETISNNQEGFITTFGEVREINTTGAKSYGGLETWVDGDILYLDPDHAGYLTNVKPTAPHHLVTIGYVVYSHAVHGKIFVKVDNGYELGELHDVYVPTPSNNDVLYWNNANNRYQVAQISTILGYTPSNDALVVHLAGNETITGAKVFNNNITLGDRNFNVNEGDSYTINFLGHGTSGVSQSASIFLDGSGGSPTTAGLKISSSGFIQLIPSSNEVLISGTNPMLYTVSGLRLLANSGTAGITIGNGYPQTTGNLFRIINNGTDSILTVAAATGNVIIGGDSTSDVSTAQLNLTSTSKGLLIPRLTTTQKNAISTPATNLIVNDTTKKTLDQYNGTSWNSIAGDYISRDLLAMQFLGSPIKAGPLMWFFPNSGAGLSSTRSYFNAIYVEREITISGAVFLQTTQGVYTGNNYNGIGLYSYSNGVVTLIDSTPNDTEFWKSPGTSTLGTWIQRPFSGGSRTLQPGVYYLCALYNSSAQTTAPAIGAAVWTCTNALMPLTTNSSRVYGGIINTVTALPATQSCSAWNNVSFYFGLYLY